MAEKTDWHDLEKKTMIGDHFAALRVVNALRTYRAASTKLLDGRHDGAVDVVSVTTFSDSIEEIDAAGT